MGRPPCCDKVGVKKGPWTPEEDIILVSYIQEHGPGNWRSVPTNTGLLRCSKSCRLRWTNYLRPGIKRGNFTPHEEGMIIHLQALLGNKWAAIASYLPQRTDNDIKNYWNTHLKKKLKKFQSSLEVQAPNNIMAASSDIPTTSTSFVSKSSSLRLSNQMVSSNNSTYASSTENISRLLEGWMRSSPKDKLIINQRNGGGGGGSESDNEVLNNYSRPTKVEQLQGGGGGGEMISSEEFESILSFDNLNNNVGGWDDKSSCYSTIHNNKSSQFEADADADAAANTDHEMAPTSENKKQRSSSDHQNNNPPLSILENWLFDETSGHVEEIMQLSPIF